MAKKGKTFSIPESVSSPSFNATTETIDEAKSIADAFIADLKADKSASPEISDVSNITISLNTDSAKESINIDVVEYSPIPYASQWELNDDGRPVGILTAIGKMMMGWRNLKPDVYPYRRDLDTPDQVLIQTYLQNLGLESTIQYPLFYGDILQGDICLVNYSGFNREKIQDKLYHNWTWVIFVACDGKTVTIHDPNWGGKAIEGGKLLKISVDEWKEIFQAHNRGYTVVRLLTHGVREGKVNFPPEPLDEIFIELDPKVVVEMNPEMVVKGVLYPLTVDPLAYPDKEDDIDEEPEEIYTNTVADHENDGLLK